MTTAVAPPRAGRRRRALPGCGLSLGITTAYLGLIILLPIAALLIKTASLSPAEFWAIISSDRAVATYTLTLRTAAIATLINGVFGFLLAWILVRYSFPGRRVLDAAVDVPFALPTAVAGIALTALYARNGWLGAELVPLGFKVAYAEPGIVLAMAFTSLPFVVRTIQPVLEDLDDDLEEAAFCLGASGPATFRRVIMPALMPAFIAGCALAFARSLGEFGAIVFIAGNRPFQTEITALLAFIRIGEFDYAGAAAIATVILVTGFVMLLVTNLIQARLLNWVKLS